MMTRFSGIQAVLLASALFSVSSSRAWCDDFMVKLSLKNAHLRSVFFGCSAKGSAGYDRRVDDFAPPPGIQTGYVGFVPGVKGLPLYYKDVRGPEPQQQWQFYVKVHEGKPVSISWDQEELPAGWEFTVESKSGDADMRREKTLSVTETQVLKISGSRAVTSDAEHGAPEGTTPKKNAVP